MPTAPGGSPLHEFTYGGYRHLLQGLRDKQYRTAAFPEAEALLEARTRFALLRHDIDFDLEAAARMAAVEAEAGVRASYFFLLRTEHYNLFTKEGSAHVESILKAGHHLGLHFDCAAYAPGLPVEGLAEACQREIKALGGWFRAPVDIVSYHRPNQLVLTGEAALSAPTRHTYEPLFTRSLCYRSDSRGEWKHGTPDETEAFAGGLPLHILVHPVWWKETRMAPLAVLEDWEAAHGRAIRRSMAANCTVYRVPAGETD